MSQRAVILPAFGRKVFKRQAQIKNLLQSFGSRPKHCARRKVKVLGFIRRNARPPQKFQADFAIGQPIKSGVGNIGGGSRINHADRLIIGKRFENFSDSVRVAEQSPEKIFAPVELLRAAVKRFFGMNVRDKIIIVQNVAEARQHWRNVPPAIGHDAHKNFFCVFNLAESGLNFIGGGGVHNRNQRVEFVRHVRVVRNHFLKQVKIKNVRLNRNLAGLC